LHLIKVSWNLRHLIANAILSVGLINLKYLKLKGKLPFPHNFRTSVSDNTLNITYMK